MSYNTKPKFETLKGKIKITPNFKGINCNLVLKKTCINKLPAFSTFDMYIQYKFSWKMGGF